MCVHYARQHAIARICHANSVSLSVCRSVTRVICTKTAERIIEILSPSDRPIILVFRHQGLLLKSDDFTANGGAKYKGVAIFDQYAAIKKERIAVNGFQSHSYGRSLAMIWDHTVLPAINVKKTAV